MKIGAHVSIAGNMAKAPENAVNTGGECFQIFSRPPQGGPATKITAKLVAEFKRKMKQHRQGNVYIHTPYFINFASANNRVRFGSVQVVREELERASLLGAKAVITHLGSAKDFTKKAALAKVTKGLDLVFQKYAGSAILLLENSAGAGRIIGDDFSELATIIKALTRNKPWLKKKIGVCFDTCHAFASGYDLRTATAMKKTLAEFEKKIGLAKLMVIHSNDAREKLGSKIDRHEHIGHGKIGEKGFEILLSDKRLKKADVICETEGGGIKADLKLLKSMRDE